METNEEQWISPSFSSYSQNNLAQIAVKVAAETDGDRDTLTRISENNEEVDFEFCLILNDEFEVSEGEIKFGPKSQSPIFPVFNRDLVKDFESQHHEEKVEAINVPLRTLFIEENEQPEPPSSSSSDSDEVESIPPGTYCIWKPKPVPASPNTCKKSKSTGFGSKRWKLRDLLGRSNSDGKDSFVFLTPKRKEENKKSTTVLPSSPGRRMIYSAANRDIMIGNQSPNRSHKGNIQMPKRKSYLPYRQDLVGFFTTANSFGRNLSKVK